ncbi:MAG: ribonuclease HII [Tissierellia bacterium]|nr:ribonuclease HII [Tissierellia bacterium]
MLEIEKELMEIGYKTVACIDEVGRGCLAGDVVACAIVMPLDNIIPEVKDSKKLSYKKREELYNKILDKAIAVGLGQVDPNTIDQINIKEATRLAMRKAVENMVDKDGKKIIPDYLLIDAENVPIEIPQRSIVKGDEKIYGIACASIVAKVYRDRMCQEWGKKFKGYKIEKNKGYGTREHREAIINLGPSPLHRKSFLKKILNDR